MVLRGMTAKSNRRKLKIRASAADGGRPRLLYAVDDVNKPRMNPNRSPGRRRPNRAFPQNQADLDPHRHAVLSDHGGGLLTGPNCLYATSQTSSLAPVGR